MCRETFTLSSWAIVAVKHALLGFIRHCETHDLPNMKEAAQEALTDIQAQEQQRRSQEKAQQEIESFKAWLATPLPSLD